MTRSGFAVAAAALFCGLATGDAAAAGATRGSISIEAPWARATIVADRPSAAYMVIRNTGPADALVSASSPVAGKVEIHESRVEGGATKMVEVAPLTIPANGTVQMKPGGFHIMLLDLKRPLRENETIPLRLTFKNAGGADLQVEVRRAEPMGPHGSGGTMR